MGGTDGPPINETEAGANLGAPGATSAPPSRWLNLPTEPLEVFLDILEALREEDFPRFAKWLRVVDKETRAQFSFGWETWHQEQRTFQLNRTGRDIIVKPRQVGMSTLELARDLFYALCRPNRTVLIVAHKDELATELLSEVKRFYGGLAQLAEAFGFSRFIKQIEANPEDAALLRTLHFPSLTAKNSRWKIRNQAQQVKLHNGSLIKASTAGAQESKARAVGIGASWKRLHLTEVAQWAYPEAVWNALTPALPKDAEVVLESTPLGVGDLFHGLYTKAQKGLNNYRGHFFPWYLHGAYSLPLEAGEEVKPQTDIERELVVLGCSPEQLKWFRQKVALVASLERTLTEYPIDDVRCFQSSGGMFLSSDGMERVGSLIKHPVNRDIIEGVEVKIYAEPQGGAEYVLGSDVATGGGGDESTAVIVNRATGALVAVAHSNRTPPHQFARLILAMGLRWNGALIAVEEAAQGIAVLGQIIESQYPNLYRGVWAGMPGGWKNNRESRTLMLDHLKHWVEESPTVGVLDPELGAQLQLLAWDPASGKVRAQGKTKKGIKSEDSPKDDVAFGYGIALFVQSECPPFKWQTPITVRKADFARDSFF